MTSWRSRLVFAVLAALLFLGDACAAPSRTPTASSGPIEKWVKETRFHVTVVNDSVYHVDFNEDKARQHSGGWRVYVFYNNKGRGYVCVLVTAIHRPKGFIHPRPLLQWCLEYNCQTAGSKWSYDSDDGDIQISWDIPTELATPDIIDWVVNDSVCTVDEKCDQMLRLLAE